MRWIPMQRRTRKRIQTMPLYVLQLNLILQGTVSGVFNEGRGRGGALKNSLKYYIWQSKLGEAKFCSEKYFPKNISDKICFGKKFRNMNTGSRIFYVSNLKHTQNQQKKLKCNSFCCLEIETEFFENLGENNSSGGPLGGNRHFQGNLFSGKFYCEYSLKWC